MTQCASPTAAGVQAQRNALGLSQLEIASGMVLGENPAAQLPSVPPGLAPLEALKTAVRAAIGDRQSFVSFSGGQDSSLVLAVAATVAREEGLPLPVPVTLRFPGFPETDESWWQERVIGHLGLADWHRIEVADELDFIGPVAQTVLRRHGLLFPANAYVHAPVLDASREGVLLSGVGGDQVFLVWRWQRLARVLKRQTFPGPVDLLYAAGFCTPWRLRRAALHRHMSGEFWWLRPNAHSALLRAWTAGERHYPRTWPRWVAWFARRRSMALWVRSYAALAEARGASIAHPLFHPLFLAAVARAGGTTGWGHRTAALTANFARLLPPDVLNRTSKVSLGRAFTRTHMREFVREWQGEGVDPELVNIQRLRAAWHSDRPDLGTILLLHSAWLTKTGDGATTSEGA